MTLKHELTPIKIEGSKAGSEKARQPKRENDSASTLATMSILYGLSEGVVRGFGSTFTIEDIKKRLYMDGTPVMAADGTVLQEVEVDFRDGSVQQTPIEGMPSQTVETPIDLELRAVAPIARTFNRAEVDSYEVRISIPQLVTNTIEGDSLRRQVEFAIDIATDSGSFSEFGRYTIYEKITQGFQRTYPVQIPKAGTRTIRVRRLTADNTSDLSVDTIIVEAMVEVVEVQFTYPHTALLWVRYDARNYSSVPKMELLMDGKADLRLPANYDPETREYRTTGVGTTGGVWDGTWKIGYSDNPVWHWFDLATAARYGTGNRITIDIPDKFYLYSLARYCDELVPDGAGGYEPRFTCNNLYLQAANDAFQVFKDISSIFRAKTVWDGAHLNPKMDVPRDAMLVFSRANVSNVKYSATSDSAQHNLIGVQYYDTANQYKSKYAYARDLNDIRQRGRIVDTNVSALGCTSEGQAQRMATYLLQSELKETRIVTFTTGLDGMRPILGDVFVFADDLLAGKTTSGRVVSVAGTTVTLDRELTPSLDIDGTFIVNTTEKFASTRKIVAIDPDDPRVITLDAAITVVDITELVWAVRSVSVGLREYTIDDIEYDSDAKMFNISGVQYSRVKYPASDGAARIETAPVTIIDPLLPSAPASVVASYFVKVDQGSNIAVIDVAWSQVAKAAWYEIEMRRDGSPWQSLGRVVQMTFTIDNAYLGIYEFRVRAIDAMSTASAFATSHPLDVRGKILPPPVLEGLKVEGKLFGVNIDWVFPAHSDDSRSTRLRVTFQNPATTQNPVAQEYDVAYPAKTFTIDGMSPNVQVWVQGALIDSYGTLGAFTSWAVGTSIADASQVLDLLDGQLTETQLDQGLRDKIEIGVEAGEAAENAQNAADAAAVAANAASSAAANAQTAAANAKTAADNAQASANAAAAEVQQLATDVDADMTALSTDLNTKLTTLGNGLTQETTDRQNADTQIVGQLNAYKTSNDAAVAGVLQKAEAATSASTANAQALTSLTATVNTKNRTYRQTTAPTTGLVLGDLWINTTAGQNNQIRRWNGTAWDDLTDPRTAANATALTNLQTTVTAIDGRTTANANSITQLRTDLTTLSNTVGTKADASALTSLQATVTQQGNDIVSNTSALTSLQSQVTTNTNNIANKLDASVITNYYTKTEANAATAGAIQTYDTSLVIGGENLYLGANPITLSGRAGELNVVTNDAGAVQLFKYLTTNELDMTQLAAGDKTVASMEFFIPSATNNDFEFRFATYRFNSSSIDSGSYNQTALLKASQFPRDKWFQIALPAGVLPSAAVAASNINISVFVYRRFVGDAIKWRNLMLEKGTKASAYSEPTSVLKSSIAANATAITQTKSDVTALNGTVTAQGTQLTNLASRVTTVENGLSTKADATALTNLTTRVTAAEGNITSQGTQLTSLRNDLTVTTATANGALPRITSTSPNFKQFRNILNYFSASTITDNLVIETPITFTQKMTDVTIKGYMYRSSDTTLDLRVGFYTFNIGSPPPFRNTSVTNSGSHPVTVRLGIKDTKAVIILTSMTGNFPYPQFSIDASLAYTLAPDTWANGWACTPVAEADLETFGVTSIQTPTMYDPKSAIAANATALTSLTNTVTQQGTQIASHSTQLTNLNNSITSINSTLATKADSTALTTLESKVTANTNNITAQGTQLTQLGNRVTTVENGLTTKADAVALTNLATRVTATENGLTTQATQITTLKADLSSGGAVNLGSAAFTDPQVLIPMFNGGHTPSLVASELRTNGKAYNIRNSTSGTGNYIYMGVFNNNSEWRNAPIRVRTGKRYLLSAYMKSDATPAQVSMQLRVFAGDGVTAGTLTGALVTTGSPTNYAALTDQLVKYTWVIPTVGLVNAQTATLLFRGNLLGTTPVNANIMLDNIMFEELSGDPVEGSPYVAGSPDIFALTQADTANANAITTTNAEVSRINGVVVAQGTQLTNLASRMTTVEGTLSTKADATALTSLTTRVTNAETTLSSQATSLTNLTAELNTMTVGGANLWSLQATGHYAAGVVTAPYAQVTVAGNIITYTNKATGSRIGCNVPLTSGQQVTIRFKPIEGVNDGVVYMRALTSTGAQADSQKTATATLKDGYYSVTLPTTQFPSTTASVNFGIGGAGATTTTTLSEVTVQYGNKATAWTDSYRDIPVIDLSGYATTAALSTLDAKVTNIDGRVTANSTQLTQLNSSLTTTNTNVTAAQNAADAAASLAGSKGKVLVQTAAPAAADRLVQNLWIDITGNANTPKRWNGSAWVAVTDKVATDAAAAAANALSVAQTKADASALTSLTTKVDTIDGKVTAQATQLTSLSTTVGNHTASITSQQTTINGLSAKATIQVAAGNTVGGIALGNNGGVVDFIVRANTFAVAPPTSAGAGDTGKYAFNYRATPTTLPNGTVVSAGLYLNNLIVDYIDASKIYADNLSAITANVGTFITLKDPTKPNGARMILEGSLIRIYDDNNVMRVRMGLWS